MSPKIHLAPLGGSFCDSIFLLPAMYLIFSTSNRKICYFTTCHISQDLTFFGIKLSNRINIFNSQASYDLGNFSAKNDCQSHAKGFALACKLDAYGAHIAFDICQRQILLCVVISYW